MNERSEKQAAQGERHICQTQKNMELEEHHPSLSYIGATVRI